MNSGRRASRQQKTGFSRSFSQHGLFEVVAVEGEEEGTSVVGEEVGEVVVEVVGESVVGEVVGEEVGEVVGEVVGSEVVGEGVGEVVAQGVFRSSPVLVIL